MEVVMSEIRYGKPNLNNLPHKLGKAIFEEILNSKPVDRKKQQDKVEELKKKMIEARKRENW